ncbi:MAG: hypothetical protein IJJ33_13630, partial [Victivallales bacterium]|nr:hypothetical protein [Victivallales bacterium]
LIYARNDNHACNIHGGENSTKIVKIVNVRHPTAIFSISDANDATNKPGATNNNVVYCKVCWSGRITYAHFNVSARHGKTANAVYLDGHVAPIVISQVDAEQSATNDVFGHYQE